MEIYLDLSQNEAAIVARSLRRRMEAQSSPEQAALEKVLHALAAQALEAEQQAERHAGYIDWTLEDESFEPFGRQFEVRVFYTWVGSDPGNQVTPSFGGYAEIADIEILGVRYFNDRGDVLPPAQYHVEAAWKLLAKESSRIEEACTQAGKSAGVDGASTCNSPLRTSIRRIAPSVRERSAESRRRASG